MEGVLTAAAPLGRRLLECGLPSPPLLVALHGGGCHSGYFDLPGFSVARAARDAGFDVLLVDRPGHGTSAPAETAAPIREAAGLIADAVLAIMGRRRNAAVAVIGHSIGGAVALTIAAEKRLPVRGVAVSGIGRTPTEPALAWFAGRAAADAEPPSSFFFGPEATLDWRGPVALRKATAPWRADEVAEVLTAWPERFDAVAGAIEAPVSFRLAEHERIWRTGPEEVARAAARFGRALRVDAGVLPDGGHLYEIHRRGAELIAHQTAFLARACGSARA